MPRDPIPDDLKQAQRRGRVALRAADGRALAPRHPARARALVRRGRARLIRRHPPPIRLRDPGSCAAGPTVPWAPAANCGLTLRYKTNDQLWFSFFHEAVHILKHGKKLLVLEGSEGLDPELEREAGRFAADLLIPHGKVGTLNGLRSAAQVEQAARRLGVAPGIVVGRMQKEEWLPWTHLNKLKVRCEWTQSEGADR